MSNNPDTHKDSQKQPREQSELPQTGELNEEAVESISGGNGATAPHPIPGPLGG